MRNSGTNMWIAPLLLLVCGVLVLYPLAYLIIESLNTGDAQTFPPDEYGLANYTELFEEPKVILNTLFVACIATVMAVFFGFLQAWILTRTAIPGRARLERLMQLPYYMTPLIGALSCLPVEHLILTGPRRPSPLCRRQ